jgi:hypothetical protein
MRKHLVFLTSLFVLIGLAGYLVEFIILPKARHPSRDTYLMGWIGHPGNQLDDTLLNRERLTRDVPERTDPLVL